MKVEELIKVLTEFNKWRRGEPPYEWNDDPAKQMELQYSAKEIGVVIDEAINMLKHADMIEKDGKREKKYEYTAVYIQRRTGKIISKFAYHFNSFEEAKRHKYCPLKFEKLRFVRREVGEWEVVPNEAS